jgi:hypothetical protein
MLCRRGNDWHLAEFVIPLARIEFFALGIHRGRHDHLHKSAVRQDRLSGQPRRGHFLYNSFERGVPHVGPNAFRR